ncbi:MAG: hypothetical protein HQL26_05610 [Candidatus Omnitrophica bacterium]|nr:hypothetical protein [Candidatus Omnitrophota bacterium]
MNSIKIMLLEFIRNQIYEIKGWCRGRNGYARIPLVLLFMYIFFRHLTSIDYQSILHPLNLGIHEFGHLIFSFAGQFINILGGPLIEVAAPFAGMWNFYVQKDYFSLMLCLGWLSTALFSCARYVGDARSMELPLVSPFGTACHDWNYLLGEMHILPWDHAISSFIGSIACLSMVVCLWASGWIIWSMINQPNK